MTPKDLESEIDALANELANYWYQESKYTPNGRWQECKDEALRELRQLLQDAQKKAYDDGFESGVQTGHAAEAEYQSLQHPKDDKQDGGGDGK